MNPTSATILMLIGGIIFLSGYITAHIYALNNKLYKIGFASAVVGLITFFIPIFWIATKI